MSITYEEVLKIKKEQKINLLMKKNLKQLPYLITSDETLISFILSNTNPQGLLCITDKRLLFISAKFNSKTLLFGKNTGLEVQSITLDMVNSLSSANGTFYGTISFNDGAQTFLYEKLISEEIQRFMKFTNQAIADYK